jgi:energy-coupling factor transport system substrate-specific component
MAVIYWKFEKKRISPREVAVIAVLGSLAAIGRVPLMFIPGVQPTTFLVIASGYVFGPVAGFMIGSTAALVSNFFLGQGPWTPWQMFAWGLAGLSAGLLKQISPRIGRVAIAAFCFAWGYFFGWIMNLWSWSGFIGERSLETFLVTYAASFWFDTLHAIGNAGFCLVFGSAVLKTLERFRRKLEVQVVQPHTVE